VNVHEKLNSRYGDVVKVSHLPGRRDLLFLFNPDDIAKMLRSEIIWPVRPGLESLTYYRTVTKRDFFEGKGGLLTE
jgi:cytochrome P450 family 12